MVRSMSMAGSKSKPPGEMAGNFQEALDSYLPLETLAHLIQLIRSYYEHWGRWPSATEVRALLKKPS